MTDLLVTAVTEALPGADAPRLTSILLATTRGLEADLDMST